MAQNDRVQRVLLQWEADQASLKRTLQGNAQISGSIQQVGQQQQQLQNTTKLLQVEFDKVGRGRQFDALALNFAKARAEGKDTTAEVERLTRALQALGATKAEIAGVVAEATRLGDEMERSSANAGGLGNGGRLGRIGSELRMLPSVQIPGLGIGSDAVANVIRLGGAANTILETTGISLTQVALAGGIAGAALVGLVTIFGEASKESEEARKRVEAFSQSLADVAVRTAGGATSRQLQDELAQRQREQANLSEQIDRLSGLRERANQLAASVSLSASGSPLNTPEFAALQAVNAEIRDLTGGQVESFQELGGVIEALQGKTKDANAEIAAINVLLGSAAVAANDAAEAQRLLTESRIKGTQADADEARQNAVQSGEFARLSTQQAEARLASLRDENNGLQAAMQAIGLSYGASTDMIRDAADRFSAAGQNDIEALTSALQAAGVPPELIEQYLAYRDQLRQNKDDIDRLNDVYLPLIKNREREEQALKDMVKASDELNKARTKVQDAEAALATEAARNADAIAKINAELLDKQYEINRKAQLAIDEAQLDAEQGRVKAQDDANKKRLEAQQKADESLLKAQRQFNRDYGNAVANRDALAAFQAKQSYDDEKADIKSALKAQQKEIDTAYKEQLRTVDARLRDQLRVIEQRRTEELRLAAKAASAALTLEAQKHNAEISMRQQALNIAVQQYRMFISQLNAAVGSYNGGQIYLPQVVDLPPVQNQQQAYQQFLAYQRSQIPGFAGGLERVPYDNFLMRAHQDESVLNKQEARMWREWKSRGGSNVAIAIQLDGKVIRATSADEAGRVVAKTINTMFGT